MINMTKPWCIRKQKTSADIENQKSKETIIKEKVEERLLLKLQSKVLKISRTSWLQKRNEDVLFSL